MTRVEIAFRAARADPGGTWRLAEHGEKGQVVAILQPGLRVEPADFLAWVGGTDPPGLATLQPIERAIHSRAIRQLSFLTNAATTPLIAWQIGEPQSYAAWLAMPLGAERTKVRNFQLARFAQTMFHAQQAIATMGAFGWDSNWGDGMALRDHAVLIADLELSEIREVEQTPFDVNAHPFAPRQRRAKFSAYAVPYERLFSQATIEAIQNPNVRAWPNRNATPLGFSAGLELLAELRAAAPDR